jgi:hypothetical protein
VAVDLDALSHFSLNMGEYRSPGAELSRQSRIFAWCGQPLKMGQ